MKADYLQSRDMAAKGFPFYALLAAAALVATNNGDQRTADMIRNCWGHEIEGRPYDQQVADKLVEVYPNTSVESLLMTAMRQADSNNDAIFKRVWPDLRIELQRRYDAPGGNLPEDTEEVSAR